MSLSHLNFVIIYIIPKIWILPKNQLNYRKDSVFKCFLNKSNRLRFF